LPDQARKVVARREAVADEEDIQQSAPSIRSYLEATGGAVVAAWRFGTAATF
jgi:hypothetical protein